MSFHGGFVGCVLAVVLFARRRGISILSLGDLTCAVGTIGLFLGRIANFINGELWGRPTDVPWAMVFPGGGPLPRHPSQLYEASARRAGAVRRALAVDPRRRAEAAGFGDRRVRGRLFDRADRLRILPRARSAARISLGGLTMGMLLSVPLMLTGVGLHRPPRLKRTAAARLTTDGDHAARNRNPPPHRAGRADAGAAIHGAVPHPSRCTAITRRAIRSAATAISSPRRRSARCSAS